MTVSRRLNPQSSLRSITVAMVGLFCLLAASYSIATPVFEATDESEHYPYVKHLADGNGLPVAQPGSPLKQEATQPPLYYGIAAVATAWIDSSDLKALLETNPHWGFEQPRPLADNHNRYVRAASDTFPYSGAARAVHIARLVSVLFGALAVVATAGLCRELFPELQWLALGATALVAFNPQFVRVSATVSNDSAVVALVATTAWLSLHWRNQSLRAWQVAGIGTLAGIAVLAKASGIIAIGLVAIVLILWKLPTQSWKRRMFELGGVVAVFVVVAGWWFLRNLLLYGELSATTVHFSLIGGGHMEVGNILQLWNEVERTYWLAFGWGQIRAAPWIYELLGWLRNFALIGLLIHFLRVHRVSKSVALLVAWIAMTIALFLYWITLVGTVSHGRLLFPALPALGMLGALGLAQWVPDRGRVRWAAAFGLATAFFLLCVAGLFLLIVPAFQAPPRLQQADIAIDLPRLNYRFNGAQLVAAEITPVSVKPGDDVSVDVYWESLVPMDKNYSVLIRLLDHDRRVLSSRNTYPGLGKAPTKYWSPKELLRDRYTLPMVVEAGGAPQVVSVLVGMFDYHSPDREALAAQTEGGQEITPFVGQLKVIPEAWPQLGDANSVDVVFEDGISLGGYKWTCQDTCTLTLYWLPTGQPTQSYTVFVQHWDEGGQVAGYDSVPRQGRYPTTWWEAGEVIEDQYELPRLSQAELLVGLYDRQTGRRLHILEADVPVRDDGVVLQVR